MRNFDTELDTQGVTRLSTTVPRVKETITARPSDARSHLTTEDWEWQQLRDYVVGQIEERFGQFPRDAKKEYGIFNSFVTRWGGQASDIAKYAFEVCDGFWRDAPIAMTRFCKNCDPYFADVIAGKLAERTTF
jgi:hypothetical protein